MTYPIQGASDRTERQRVRDEIDRETAALTLDELNNVLDHVLAIHRRTAPTFPITLQE